MKSCCCPLNDKSCILSTLVKGVHIHRTKYLIFVRSRDATILIIGVIKTARVSHGYIEGKIVVEGVVDSLVELKIFGGMEKVIRIPIKMIMAMMVMPARTCRIVIT